MDNNYLKGFGLENFRVFKDYTWFDFAPITLLIGPNNSGKSSLIKALLLAKSADINLQQNNYGIIGEVSTHPPRFNFDAPFLNLMGLENVINNQEKGTIPFYFALDDIFFKEKLLLHIEFPSNQELPHENPDYQSSFFYELLFENGEILYRLGNNNDLFFDIELFFRMQKPQNELDRTKIEDFLKKNSKSRTEQNIEKALAYFLYFYKISNDLSLKNKDKHVFLTEQEHLFQDLKKKILEEDGDYYNSIDDDLIESIFRIEIQYACKELEGLVRFEKFLEHNSLPIEFAEHFYNLLNLDSINELLLAYSLNIKYLPSIKGFQRRSFRLSEDEIFNHLIKDLRQNEYLDSIFLRKWEKVFKLEGKINWQTDTKLGVSYLDLNEKSLVDMGFGISQLIAVLLKIYKHFNRRANYDTHTSFALSERHQIKEYISSINVNPILIFEEPESNLHPAFQSKLADLFSESMSDFHTQFIIETHSEYMVRKFQYLVAKGKLKKEDIVIYYFNDPNNIPAGEPQVKKIEILEDGSLSDDFGNGFFDEAANWELELLKLKKNKGRQN